MPAEPSQGPGHQKLVSASVHRLCQAGRRARPLLLHYPCCKDGKPALSPSAKAPNLTDENGNTRVASGGNWEGEEVTLRRCTWQYLLKRCSSSSSGGKCAPARSGVSSAVPALELHLIAEETFCHLYLTHEDVTH